MGFGGNQRQAQFNAAYRDRLRGIKRRECADPRRRRRLEKTAGKWLKWYLADAYPLPFGKCHDEIISGFLYALDTGGYMAVAAPRGTGKSSLFWGLALYAVCTGRTIFPAVIPWAARDVKRAMRFWKSALCFNERLLADYPELCVPFAESQGRAQKLLVLMWEGEHTTTGARMAISEGMIVLPDSRGLLGSATANGNPRGLNHSTEDGKVLRPSLVMIDDPQDAEVARSPKQVKDAVDSINADVLGMAGPDTKLPCVMACTVIEKNDAADHFLSSAEWDSVRVPQLVKWPEHMDLWDKWNETRLDGLEQKDGGKAARGFYKTHKAEMRAGAEVSWEYRYDKKQKQPDALYAAMEDYYRMGRKAFFSERQNEPIADDRSMYELTPDMVISHAVSLPRLALTRESTVFVGHCDINRSGLHWCVACFAQDMTAHIPAYGKFPEHGDLWEKNAAELQRRQAIFEGLKRLCSSLATAIFTREGRRIVPSLLLIDRGYEPEVVHKFAAMAAYPFRVVPARGYAAHKYQPRRNLLVGRPMEGCHVSRGDFGQFVAFNADSWRETAQRAWLPEAGAPGGVTIYQPRAPTEHAEFAMQVSAEMLKNKYQTDSGMRWEWVQRPGTAWDYGDALTGCYVAGAMSGLSPSGIVIPRKRYVEKRKAKVMVT